MLDTEIVSAKYRSALIDHTTQRVLITNFSGTEQEQDLSDPPNCAGFGRIRHFRRNDSGRWPHNPLPIEPARKALGLPPTDMLRAQVFQNAACNWRCWYCFVPFNLLAANRKHAGWLSPTELIDLYLDQPDPPPMIDLTGGQPDLTPEWVLWMMDELEHRGLAQTVYLWSDDNLSNDYFWRFLSDAAQARIAAYPHYGRVGCFKGFDAASFSFNTSAEPNRFDQQFDVMRRLLDIGMDIYAYATFTTPRVEGIDDAMTRFVDRLQQIDEYLPLRTIPLQIQEFTPVARRLTDVMRRAMVYQQDAIDAWNRELASRFSSVVRAWNIVDVPLRGRKSSHDIVQPADRTV